MTISSPPSGRGDATLSPRPDVPVRAQGIQLIGELPGSGYKQPPALVRRADGQMIQLTPLLYLVLEAVDGRRTHDEIAREVSVRFGREVTGDNVATLVDTKLRPIGVLLKGDGSEPELRKSNPLLGLRMRYAVTDQAKTERLTRPFAALFHPVLVVAVTAGFLYLCWWLLLEKGLASAAREALHQPGLLLLVFVVTVLSAGFHEFGHAAAARRGGSTPGVMGMGLYLFWPAFYTDVTDSYRLGRGGRLRTDLGGLYFNAIVALGMVAVWWTTGYDALLLVVVTQILQMLRQLTPLVRFDGYHVLADLTGVPDLYHRIKPTLLGMLPWRWRDPSATALKPWARLVVTAWVVVVVPVLVVVLVLMVLTLPRLVATAWESLQLRTDQLEAHWDRGDLVSVLAQVLAIVALVLPVMCIGYLLVRLVRQVGGGVWRSTEERPVRRGLAVVTAVALVAGLAWVWWPDADTYRPITAGERGTLTDALPDALPRSGGQAPVGPAPLAEGQEGSAQVAWPADAARPTRARPGLALVMVPRDSGEPSDAEGTSPDAPASPASPDADGETGTVGTEPATWVFPFDQPLPPDDGDNQALSVNTTDGTVVYDLAFALVWVDPDAPVDNSNEAYAAASCENCGAVAVGFQVVLVVGDADVVVPQNTAVAVNYNCVQCLTYALASQLVITLDGPLSEEGMAALRALWAEIAAYAATIPDLPLSELQGALEGFQDRILEIVEGDSSVSADESSGDQPEPEPSESAEPSATATTSESPSAEPSESPSEETSADPSEEPEATESSSPSPEPSPTPETTEPEDPTASPSTG